MSNRTSYGPRQSLAGRVSSNRDSGRMGESRVSMGRQPSGRRSSVFVGRGSMAAPATSIKDSRPIRDKQWQNAAVKSLINFLIQSGYPQTITEKDLKPPSLKVFQYIFKFLYAQLDPEYEFSAKFEEDVPAILRGLRYPFSEQILKSSLMSVNSHHAWPILLAMLNWMVELILCCDQIATDYDLMSDPSVVGEPHPERIFFDYLRRAYDQFMSKPEDEPDDDSMDAELMENFDRKNEIVLRDIMELTSTNKILMDELNQLESNEPPLVVLQREQNTLKSDKERFKQWMTVVEGKTDKLKNIIMGLQGDLNQMETEINKLSAERNSCQQIVDSQGISPEDVDRMTAEQEQLKRGLELASQKMAEVSQSLWDKEIEIQKKMDLLEKYVHEYNSYIYMIGFAHNSSVPKPMSMDLELNANANSADTMVSVNLTEMARPTLASFRQQLNDAVHKTRDEIIILQEKIENLNWTKQQKTEEIKECEMKIKKLSEQYHEQQRQIGIANHSNNEEIENYEQEIVRIRAESKSAILLSQQRLQKVATECSLIEGKAADVRDNMVNNFAKMMMEVYQLKESIRVQLDGFSKLVEKEFEEASKIEPATDVI